MSQNQTVTLVHTDIEDSTALWERSPEAMDEALAQHDQLQRVLIERFGGRELRTEGDAFLVGFQEPEAAVRFACALQHEMLAQPWPEALLALPQAVAQDNDEGRTIWRGLRVRAGICTGTAQRHVDETTGRISFRGVLVHRCIAIASAANGGQILMERGFIEPMADIVTAVELGFERPSGLSDGVELVQLVPKGLEARHFPALRHITADKTNLVRPGDLTVGRQGVIERMVGRLIAGERCITITGTAGVGKSRLAQLTLLETIHAFRSGAWEVDLAAARDNGAVLQKVAEVLELPLGSGDDDAQAVVLGRAIAGRGRIALLFDDADFVAESIGELIQSWLEACPQLFVVVTSRRKVAGLDVSLRLQPLSAKDGAKLFIQRAQERRARLTLDDRERQACEDIARALDGLPLALELAASRVGVMSPHLIIDRLDARFQLLRSRRRGDHRQSTLSDAFAWSWALLGAEAQQALMALSPCRGQFDTATAAALTQRSGDELQRLLDQLVDHSMLNRRPGDRYGMTESLRMFGEEQAHRNERLQDFRQRHAQHFAAIGLALYRASQGADLERTLAQIRAERTNLLEAYSLSSRDQPELAASAALGLVPVLFTQGPLALGISLFRDLAPEAKQMNNPVRAMFRMILARVQNTMGERDLALRSAYSAAEDAKATGDKALMADATETLIRTMSLCGRFQDARQLIKQALHFARKHHLAASEARLQAAIGSLLFRMGKTEKALEAFEFAAAGFEHLGLAYPQAQALSNAGILHLAARHYESAAACFLVALRQYERMQNHTEQARANGHLGLLALDNGDLDQAAKHYAASLATGRRIGSAQAVVAAQGYLGLIDQMSGRREHAMIRYREAMEALGGHRLGRIEAYLRCFYAGLLAQTGSGAEAESHWTRARAMMAPLGDPFIKPLIALTQAQASGATVDLDPELEAQSEDLRFARRLLRP